LGLGVSIPARPAAIIFDFDGLVVDTEWAEFVSIDAVFRAHGTRLSEDLWRSFIGTTDHPHWTEILQDQIGRELDGDQLRDERVDANRSVIDALPVEPGVCDLIAAASVGGVALAVASSSPRSWVERHLRRVGLWDLFGAVSTGDEVLRTKPDPAVYELAVDRLGVGRAGVVAIEDSVTGCHAALAAGLTVVAVPSRMTTGMDFSHAHLVVDSVVDLNLELLGNLPR
jgi:HAD superfamily hydrolase (TIGR01509 family)